MNTADAAPGKAETRVENEAAVQAFQLRNLVDFARSVAARIAAPDVEINGVKAKDVKPRWATRAGTLPICASPAPSSTGTNHRTERKHHDGPR